MSSARHGADETIGESRWVPAQDRALARQRRRIAVSGLIGSSLEWFDFLLYGLIAPSVFDVLFFPSLSAGSASLAVLVVFGAAYAARPVGALVFGHYGDRVGRKPMMYVSLTLMGLATALMGLLPTYGAVGQAAPILLLACRSLQGFALGGEATGSTVLAAETGAHGRRGGFTAIIQSGGALGSVLASLAAALVARLPGPELLAWGWRVPFLASAVLVLVGLYVRSRVEESPVFRAAQATRQLEAMPLLGVLRRALRETLTIGLCSITQSNMINVFTVFGLVYGIGTLGAARADMLDGILVGNVVGVLSNPFYGALSDRLGRRPLILAAMLSAGLYLAFGFIPLLATRDSLLVTVGTAIPGALIQPMIFAVGASYFAELIPDARLRFTGVGLGGSIGGVIGGFFPAIANTLLLWAPGGSGPIAYYEAVTAVSILAVLGARETRHLRL